MYEHIYLENIKKLYKYDGKCDDQQNNKAIIEAQMVYTPGAFNDNSPMSTRKSMTAKYYSARKSLYRFLEALYVKPKTSVLSFLPLNQSRRQ